MKFKFSLQKVLDHRKIKENFAQKDYQDVLSELHVLQKCLQEMEEAVHGAHIRAGTLQSQGGTQGPALSQISEFQRNQKILIQIQKAKILNQEKIVEEKNVLLRQAAVETKIISKLKEKKLNEYRSERESEEQKEMDEQSILRFKRREIM